MSTASAGETASVNGSLDAESASVEELRTAPTGSIVTLSADQTVADNTVTKVQFDTESTRGNVSELLSESNPDNAVVVPEGFNWARLTVSVRWDQTLQPDVFRAMLNDATGNLGWHDWSGRDYYTAQIQTVATAWFSVSEGDAISFEVRQRSGGDVDISSSTSGTFMEVELR